MHCIFSQVDSSKILALRTGYSPIETEVFEPDILIDILDLEYIGRYYNPDYKKVGTLCKTLIKIKYNDF